MDSGDEWEKSQCADVWLHRYNIVAQSIDCVMEVCEICGDEQYYKILEDGSSDNQEYISRNLRMALPFDHPYSKHEYSDLLINYA